MSKIEWQTATVCEVDGCYWPAGITGLCWPHSRGGHFPKKVRKRRRSKHDKPLCTVATCDRTSSTKGLCRRHYQANFYKKKQQRLLTGIDERKKKFDREESIAFIQNVALIFGKSISIREYMTYHHENGGPPLGTIQQIFGNWNSFKSAAGLELILPGRTKV